MVCLGPRKKEKKASLLSPEDANTTSRGVSSFPGSTSGASKRGSKLKPPSKISQSASPAASQKKATSPRPSVDGRRTSRTSVNSQRPTSPAGRRPQSPQTSSRQSMVSVRSTTPTSRTPATHSRNTSVASVKKSPVAQMRQDFDTLKVKYDANEQLIAQQQAELDLLKQQLAHTSPPATPMLPPLDQPTPPISHSTTLSDLQQAQALLDKEETLKQKEREIAELQLKLELASKSTPLVPSIVVQNDNEKQDALAEKERLLAEKEASLEKQRQQVEKEQQLALEQVALQMEKLRVENEEAVAQLAVKEKELDNLRTHIQDTTASASSTTASSKNTEEASDALIKLQQQLDEQNRAHEERLRQHEAALIEKERLLKEKEQALAALKDSHDENVRQLRTQQTSNILKIKQQHKQDMEKLRQQMEQVEKTKQEQMQQQGDQAKQKQEYLDAELEKILHAFEQAEHNHTAQLQDLEYSHQDALSSLQQSHVDQLKTIGASQGYTSSRYVPTQAVSWPAPQPLSMLRKTSGPAQRANRVILAVPSSTSSTPILTPLDPKKVQIYISSVSGNSLIKKNQEHIQQLLEAQDVSFELVDVAASEAVLQYMKRCNNNGSSDGRAKEVPQLFVGGEFRALYDDVVKHVEKGTLDELLIPAAERQWSDAEREALQKASMSSNSNGMPNPPVRVLPSGPVHLPTLRKTNISSHHTSSSPSSSSASSSTNTAGATRSSTLLNHDDEALLKELEEEFKEGNVDLSQLDYM